MTGATADLPRLKIFSEAHKTRKYQLSIGVFIILSYSSYLVFDEPMINKIGDEDGFFEYLTAALFLGSAFYFTRAFLKTKNIFFLLLGLLFFAGFGEEISWGQRIFHVETPEYFEQNNVQGELTLHNLEVFNAKDFDNNLKTGLEKILTVNFLYNLFWFSFGILLPLFFMTIPLIRTLCERIRLPIPALTIGCFFLLNWLTFRITKSFFLADNKSLQYYDTIGEIQECGTSFIFLCLSLYFFHEVKTTSSKKMSFSKSIE
jgi:hypothetical protein